MKYKDSLEKIMSRVESIADNDADINTLINNAHERVKNSSILSNVLDKICAMIRMIKAVINRSYCEFSKSAILKAIAAMAYLVWPADAIPDFIPITGLVDDAVVITYIFNQIEDEIMRFQIWENSSR